MAFLTFFVAARLSTVIVPAAASGVLLRREDQSLAPDNKKDSVAAAKSATRAELRELVGEDERTSLVDDKQNTLEEAPELFTVSVECGGKEGDLQVDVSKTPRQLSGDFEFKSNLGNLCPALMKPDQSGTQVHLGDQKIDLKSLNFDEPLRSIGIKDGARVSIKTAAWSPKFSFPSKSNDVHSVVTPAPATADLDEPVDRG